MTVAKAIVAGIMAMLFLINHFVGIDFGIDEAAVTGVVDVLIALFGTFMTFRVPNKEKTR